MRWLWAFLFVTCLGGCGDGSGPSDLEIAVLISTWGIHQDPDGYALTFDGGPEHAVPTSGWFHHRVDGRDHTVMLWGVAPNCKVAGENPVSVAMSKDGALYTDKVVEFSILCDWNARAKLTAATTGSNFDPASDYGFDASWWSLGDWRPLVYVPVNGSLVLGPYLAGQYVVHLYVGANCAVKGDNPRPVALIHEQLVETVFEVECQ